MHVIAPSLLAGLLVLGPSAASTGGVNAVMVERQSAVTPGSITLPRSIEAPRAAGGLGIFAISKDRSLDLGQIGRSVVGGPVGSPFATAAGVGWRNENLSAMVGYLQPEAPRTERGASAARTASFREPAHLGLALALHF